MRAQIAAHPSAELRHDRLRAVQLVSAEHPGVVCRRRAGGVGGLGPRGSGATGALVLCGGGEVGAQALHGIAHAAAHFVGDQPHRVGEAGLDALELTGARFDLGVPGGGDRVDRLAAVHRLADETLFFELRQARVDRAGARRVGAAGAVGERLHDVVAVPWALVEEIEQVQAQIAVGEDGGHHHSSSASFAASGVGTVVRRSTVRLPETELARTSTKRPLSSPIEPA